MTDAAAAAPPRRRAAARYGVALLAAAVAVALTVALAPLLPRTSFVFAFGAVAVGAWFGGFGPGIAAALACVLGVDYYLFPPVGEVSLRAAEDLFPLGVFLAVAGLVGSLTHSLRVSRDSAAAQATAADRAAAELAEQALELELANQQLVEETREREAHAAELQRAGEALAVQTDAAVRARGAAELAAERSRRLQHLTARLNEATTQAQVADVIFADGLAVVGADAGSLAVVHADAAGHPAEFEIVRAAGYATEVSDRYRRFPVAAGRPFSDAVLERAVVCVGSPDEWRARWPAAPEDLTALGFAAFAAVPVGAGDRAAAVLSFSYREPHAFDDATRTFLATLGEQCALALERQRLHDAEVRAGAEQAALLATIQDPFVALDGALCFAYVNGPAEALLGRPAAALLGRPLADAFPDGGAAPYADAARRVLASGRGEELDALRATSGRWLDARLYPAPDGVAIVLQDVTARRRAQDAADFVGEASRLLAQSLDFETTLRALAAAAVPRLGDWCAVDVLSEPRPVGAAAPWPPAVERLAAVHQDPAKVAWARDLERSRPTDWSAPTGLPRVLRDGVTEFYPVITDETLAALARSPEELALLREIGFHAYVCVPLVARGLTLGALTLCTTESRRHYDDADRALVEDLAQRAAVAVDNARLYREAERARARAEESRAAAEAASQAKSQFLATMSHELRTPLNAIQGHAQLMELGLHGPVTDAQRTALDRVQRAQRHLLGLINDVLTYARIEGGRVEYDLAPVAAADVVADVVPLLEPQFRAKAIALETRLPGAPVVARADREKFAQILLNLLSNAAKFTGEGGRVTVEVPPADGASEARVRVRDTGVGIAADKLEAIFEPFVQVRAPYAPAAGGTGLGLAISRDLARGMGGDLTAESTPGEGSTFTLTLPRAGAA